MKLSEILTPCFKGTEKRSIVQPTDDSDFCHEAVDKGWLTKEQMEHAAMRYRLGRSRSGRTIFWMIDERQRVRDGRIGDSWASQMLKAREPELLQNWHTEHCLFGLHLLSETQISTNYSKSPLGANRRVVCEKPLNLSARREATLRLRRTSHLSTKKRLVCIVEKEATAVVMSEWFPKHVWMAISYTLNFTIDRFEPLRGHRIILFPATDPMMNTYVTWLEIAEQARKAYQLDISVSDTLEEKATPEQKEQCIDLLG